MNKIIRTTDEIEQMLQKDCSELQLDNESDRAELAWWVYQKFVKRQFVGCLGMKDPTVVSGKGGHQEVE